METANSGRDAGRGRSNPPSRPESARPASCRAPSSATMSAPGTGIPPSSVTTPVTDDVFCAGTGRASETIALASTANARTHPTNRVRYSAVRIFTDSSRQDAIVVSAWRAGLHGSEMLATVAAESRTRHFDGCTTLTAVSGEIAAAVGAVGGVGFRPRSALCAGFLLRARAGNGGLDQIG